jgi:hypothetical protein
MDHLDLGYVPPVQLWSKIACTDGDRILSHHLYTLILRGELYLAPISKNPQVCSRTPGHFFPSTDDPIPDFKLDKGSVGYWDRNWHMGNVRSTCSS